MIKLEYKMARIEEEIHTIESIINGVAKNLDVDKSSDADSKSD